MHRLTAPLVAVAVSLGLVTCAPVRELRPSPTPWTNYAINEVRTSSTGSSMVVWMGKGLMMPGFELITPVGGPPGGYQTAAGRGWFARFHYTGKSCPGAYYVVVNKDYYAGRIGIVVSEEGVLRCRDAFLQVGGGQKGRAWPVDVAVGTRIFEAEEPRVIERRASAFKWELIYSGRSGDRIKIAYREYFSANGGVFARPAFSQELEYDLSRGSRITFREIEIEIFAADNIGVKFRVLRDENTG